MAEVNKSSLETLIQTKIDAYTTATSLDTVLSGAASINAINTGSIAAYVSSVSDLPNLYSTTFPAGQIVFVSSIGLPVVSGASAWYGLDGCKLREDSPQNTLWTWGYNFRGVRGDGTAGSDSSSPGTTAGCGTNWFSVSMIGPTSAGTKTDGSLWTWGGQNYGSLGDTVNGGSSFFCRSSPVTIAGGGNTWTTLGTGHGAGYTFGALKSDGSLWTWGDGSRGALGDGTATNKSSPVSVAGGGTTWCAASLGRQNSLALKTDGTLWMWGYNTVGSLGINCSTAVSRTSPVTTSGGGTTWCRAAANGYGGIAVKTDGTLWTWGWNYNGQLGIGNTLNRSSPVTTCGGGTTWCAVGSAPRINAGIKTDGTLWTWGANFNGVLGDGTTTSKSSPGTTAGGGTSWCKISIDGRGFSAFGLKTDGTIWSWGYNNKGQLGDGTTTNRSSPGSIVGGFTTWTSVAAGYKMAAGLKSV